MLQFAGCTKDYNSLYTATFVNTTQHSIKIFFYKGGFVSTQDTISLNANQQFEFANGSYRGKVPGPGFTNNYFGGNNDSAVVIFDNLYKITHYVNLPTQLATKYYSYNSNRNIANVLSYRFVSTSISSHGNKNDHYYDFIEQDYLDAR